jgi:hypothetical protein
MLRRGDVVLADRYFSGWFDMALLQQRGVHVVVRKHQRRATDFRTGRRLGRGDRLVHWPKPARSDWMNPETYDTLPADLTLREVLLLVPRKGLRTRALVVVTTLLDAEKCPGAEIAQLYRRRWDAELNLRSRKAVMQMDHWRCKTPHRVRNEFYRHLVAYNLIRKVMAVARGFPRDAPNSAPSATPVEHECIDGRLVRDIDGAHRATRRGQPSPSLPTASQKEASDTIPAHAPPAPDIQNPSGMNSLRNFKCPSFRTLFLPAGRVRCSTR